MPPSVAINFDPYGLHDRLHIRLLAIRALSITPSEWTYRNVRNSYWRIYANTVAGASLRWSDVEYQLTPNSVILVPAWVQFDSLCANEVEHLYVHFDVVGLSGPTVRQWFDRPIALVADSLIIDLASAVRTLLREGPHDEIATAFAAKSLISMSFARLFKLMETGQHPGRGHLLLRHLAELTPIVPALRRIENKLADPASNTELAERCGMSEDHFIRVFQKCVGQTPARYALERRVGFAAERLVFSDDSLDAIATQAGFSNRFHFSRVFTRVIGVPPARYRKLGPV
jgi:AraC-like DNA-binding protein